MEVHRCPITYEEKRRMIAEAAFLKSRQKGASDDEVADWLQAEAEIEAALDKDCHRDRNQESSAYDRMRNQARRLMKRAQGAVHVEDVKRKMDNAAAELRQMGAFIPGKVDQASKRVRREITDGVERLEHNWDSFRSRQNEFFADWREKGSDSLNRTTKAIQDWIDRRF